MVCTALQNKCRIKVLFPYDCQSRSLRQIKGCLHLQWQRRMLWKLRTVDILYRYVSSAFTVGYKNQTTPTYARLGVPIICKEKKSLLSILVLFNMHMFICIHGPVLTMLMLFFFFCLHFILFYFLNIFIDYAITVVPFPAPHSTPSCPLPPSHIPPL